MPDDGPPRDPAPPVPGRAGRRPRPTDGGAGSAAIVGGAWTGGGEAVSTPWAIGSLVGVNLVPLVGVLAFGWSTFELMLLYWFENGIIGLFAVLKVLLARGGSGGLGGALGKLFTAGFFTLHYGAFWSVHGLFVAALFGGADAAGASATLDLPLGFFFGGLAIAGATLRGGLLLTAVGLLVSHAVSFLGNVVLGGEDLERTPEALMFQPYGRVVILHVTLVLGAGLVLGLGEPAAALVLFVFLKTAVDLAAHLRHHRARAAA